MKKHALALLLLLPGAFTALAPQKSDKKPELPKLEKKAPTFRLNNHDGELASIGGSQDDWTVLAFFPKAMTPG